MRFVESRAATVAAWVQIRVVEAMVRATRNERGSMLFNVIKVAVVLLVVITAALILSSLSDERTASRMLADAAGTDAAAPVGVRATPWLK